MKKSNAPVSKTIEAKPKRKYTKRADKWNLALECLAKAKKEQPAEKPTKRIRKESVMKIDKKELKAKKAALKKELDLEKEAIKNVAKNCKARAKELAKIVDDEEKQKLIEKLIKIGYSFDLDDPTKLVVSVNVGCTVVPKMKKLKAGAKAVVAEKPIEAPVVEEPIPQPEEPTPKLEAKPIDGQPNETIPPTEEQPIEKQPTEIPIGDTFTDDLTIPSENSPSDEELAAIENEELDNPEASEENDLANFRSEFWGSLSENGDDLNS